MRSIPPRNCRHHPMGGNSAVEPGSSTWTTAEGKRSQNANELWNQDGHLMAQLNDRPDCGTWSRPPGQKRTSQARTVFAYRPQRQARLPLMKEPLKTIAQKTDQCHVLATNMSPLVFCKRPPKNLTTERPGVRGSCSHACASVHTWGYSGARVRKRVRVCECACAKERVGLRRCVKVYACVRASVRVCVCAWVCALVCACVCVYLCLCVCVFACLRANVFGCLRVCVYFCVCALVCLCVCLFVCLCACQLGCLCACVLVCLCACLFVFFMFACLDVWFMCFCVCVLVCLCACVLV